MQIYLMVTLLVFSEACLTFAATISIKILEPVVITLLGLGIFGFLNFGMWIIYVRLP